MVGTSPRVVPLAYGLCVVGGGARAGRALGLGGAWGGEGRRRDRERLLQWDLGVLCRLLAELLVPGLPVVVLPTPVLSLVGVLLGRGVGGHV